MATIKRYNSSTGEWEYVARGANGLDGQDGLPGNMFAPVTTEDSLQEWWIYPVATYIESENRTVYGGYSASGEVLANEIDHATGETKRVVIGETVIVDDHNNPAIHAEAGRRLVLAYTQHGQDPYVRFRVSDADGNIYSLASNDEQIYNAGKAATYTQIHKIDSLSDASNDVFWLFSRWTNGEWWLLPFTVPQATGTISFGTAVQLVDSDSQTYISTAKSYDGKIRVSWYHNPGTLMAAIYYLEIDIASGSVKSPLDNTTLGNVSGAGLPVLLNEVTPVLPEPVSSTTARRMFYCRPGPMTPAIAYAEWDTSDPDAAEYNIIEATDDTATSWVNHALGVIAGPRIGHASASNYIGGMSFPDPCYDNSFALCRKEGDRSFTELYKVTPDLITAKVVATSDVDAMARPIIPVMGGPVSVMFSQIADYTHPEVYTSKTVLSVERAPSVTKVSGAVDGVPTVTTDANGWRVYDHGSYKVYTRRETGLTTSATSAGAHATTGRTVEMPVGVKISDVRMTMYGYSSDGAGRWLFNITGTGIVDSPGANFTIGARNLTTSTITMSGGQVDITLTEA